MINGKQLKNNSIEIPKLKLGIPSPTEQFEIAGKFAGAGIVFKKQGESRWTLSQQQNSIDSLLLERFLDNLGNKETVVEFIRANGQISFKKQVVFDGNILIGNNLVGVESSTYIKVQRDSPYPVIYSSRSDGSFVNTFSTNGNSGYILSGGLGIGGYNPISTNNLLVNGKIIVGTNVDNGLAAILQVAGDIFSTNGLILQKPDGGRVRLSVNNSNSLIITPI